MLTYVLKTKVNKVKIKLFFLKLCIKYKFKHFYF